MNFKHNYKDFAGEKIHYHESNNNRDLDLQLMLDLHNHASAWALAGDIACAVGIVALLASPVWLPAVVMFFFGE